MSNFWFFISCPVCLLMSYTSLVLLVECCHKKDMLGTLWALAAFTFYLYLFGAVLVEILGGVKWN